MRSPKLIAAVIAALLVPLGAMADDWKDESGKGRGKRDKDRDGYRDVPSRYYGDDWKKRDKDGYRGGPAYSYEPMIPNGHLPPPGECRVWYPDRPAGHQPPPFRC